MRTNLTSGFYRIAGTQPDRIAIVDPDGSPFTFGELGRHVNQVSRALRSSGLGTGDVVAGVVHNGHEYLELVLATGQVGMYFVPVNWHLSPSEIGYILRDSEAKLVVAAAGQAREIPPGALPAHRFVVGGAAAGWRQFEEFGRDEPAEAWCARRCITLPQAATRSPSCTPATRWSSSRSSTRNRCSETSNGIA